MDWKGFVCCYVAVNGPYMQGYIGKVAEELPFHTVKLTDACEFVSVMASGGEGRTIRRAEGQPIEFTTIRDVTCVWIARVELEGLSEECLRPFKAARGQALASLATLRPGEPTVVPSPIIQPGSAAIVPGMPGIRPRR